ncbi:suppressor of rasval19 [Recurvomyces mirabilis]|nr:suppressor of rasval19 [Recurvomyces mirabilis]
MASPTNRYSTHKPVSINTSDNPLTTLIRRLEAATSRLEDIASSAASYEGNDQNSANGNGAASAVAVGGITPQSHAGSATEPQTGSKGVAPVAVAAPAEDLPTVITAMDEIIDTQGKSFVDASRGVDPLVEEQASFVAQAFTDQRRFLLVSTKAKKPDMQSPETFNVLLNDLQQHLGKVGDIRDGHRASPLKEHLAMVGEGVAALQWLLMDSKPADFVGETLGGAQMYGNRVLKEYKEKDPAHVKFVQSYYALLKALQAYVKEHYPRGLTWNNNGPDAIQTYRDLDASKATTNGVPPISGGAPPPPPPPLPNFDNVPGAPPPPPGAAPKAAPQGGDMGAIFEQLNRGESVTSGLKKVDRSQMTHKNPSLRAEGVVADSRSKSPGPGIKPKPQSMRQNSTTSTSTTTSATPTKKAPEKKELDGNKWIIENFDSPGQSITLEVEITQSILISRCKNTTIILRGKANAISIDNSPRLQILLETLVSSVDVIKSPNFAIQVTGSLPTILLDQVDGASVYLGQESLRTEIFTSKCSSINVVLPPQREEDDGKEVALPEQMRTVVRGGKLVSEIVEHAG